MTENTKVSTDLTWTYCYCLMAAFPKKCKEIRFGDCGTTAQRLSNILYGSKVRVIGRIWCLKWIDTIYSLRWISHANYMQSLCKEHTL